MSDATARAVEKALSLYPSIPLVLSEFQAMHIAETGRMKAYKSKLCPPASSPSPRSDDDNSRHLNLPWQSKQNRRHPDVWLTYLHHLPCPRSLPSISYLSFYHRRELQDSVSRHTLFYRPTIVLFVQYASPQNTRSCKHWRCGHEP